MSRSGVLPPVARRETRHRADVERRQNRDVVKRHRRDARASADRAVDNFSGLSARDGGVDARDHANEIGDVERAIGARETARLKQRRDSQRVVVDD